MDAIKPAKEICDNFFRELLNAVNVDARVSRALSRLYFQGDLTKEKILSELQTMRQELSNDEQGEAE